MRALLSSSVIAVKVIELQKSLLDTWLFFRRFLNTLTADDKYSLISRENWMQTIMLHLCQEPKFFSEVFSAFFESALNFEHFQEKMTLIAYVFPKFRPRKTCLDKCLKTPAWEELSTGDMVNGLNHWFSLNESTFIILGDHCEGNWVAKVTLRHMKILQTFS